MVILVFLCVMLGMGTASNAAEPELRDGMHLKPDETRARDQRLLTKKRSAKGNRWWPDMPSMSNSNNGLDERCAAWRAACKALGA